MITAVVKSLSINPRTEWDLVAGQTYYGRIRGFYDGLFLVMAKHIIVLAYRTTSITKPVMFLREDAAHDAKPVNEAVDVVPVNLEITITGGIPQC